MAADPGEIYWALVAPHWDHVNIYDGPERFLETFGSVPTVAGHLLATHWCQSEVCNGGFHQFFTNSTGVLAPEALVGFEAMGRSDLATILSSAMFFFGEPFPRGRSAREDALDALEGDEWNPFKATNSEFFERLKEVSYEETADLYASQGAA